MLTKKAMLQPHRPRFAIKESTSPLENVCGHVMNTVLRVKSVFFPVMLNFFQCEPPASDDELTLHRRKLQGLKRQQMVLSQP